MLTRVGLSPSVAAICPYHIQRPTAIQSRPLFTVVEVEKSKPATLSSHTRGALVCLAANAVSVQVMTSFGEERRLFNGGSEK